MSFFEKKVFPESFYGNSECSSDDTAGKLWKNSRKLSTQGPRILKNKISWKCHFGHEECAFDKPNDKKLWIFPPLSDIDKKIQLYQNKCREQSPYCSIGRSLNNPTDNSSTNCRNVFAHCLSSWKNKLFFSNFHSASNGSPGQVHCSFDYLTWKFSTEYRILFGQCSKCSERKRVSFQENIFLRKLPMET